MSFILDALKRAERERKLEKAPDLSAIYQDEHPNRRKYRPWFWGGGVALILLLAVVVMFMAKDLPRPVPVTSSPSKGPEAKGTSAPLSAVGKTVKKATPTAPVAAARKTPQKAKKEAPASKTPSQVSQETPRKRVDSVKESTEKTVEVAAAPSPEKQIETPETTAQPPRKSVVKKRRGRRSKPAAKVVPKSQPKEAIPLYDDLPEDIQSVLGPLEINVHMYSPNPSERRVFINMKGYREGDAMEESGFKVVQITSKGVVIDYGKGKALLEANPK